MSEHLRIATDDYTDAAGKVDLLQGPLKLTWGGYHPKTSIQKSQYAQRPYGVGPKFLHFGQVLETIRLGGQGAPADLQRGAVAIERAIEHARQYYEDPVLHLGRWLEWMADGEPESSSGEGSKRAFIYGGNLALTMPSDFRGGFLDAEAWATLILHRHPFFENPTVNTITDDLVDSFGGEVDITGEAGNMGTAPARIARLRLSPLLNDFNDYWCGVRPAREGISDFDPIWEAEDGTIVDTDDTSSGADGTASGGNKLTTTFNTDAGLIERSTVRLDQAVTVTNWDHFMGRYLVLLRAKVTGSAVCGIQMRYGYSSAPTSQQEEVFISNTAWQLIELGEMQIPPHVYRNQLGSAGVDVRHTTISLWHERISGAGSLEVDAFCLIPAEHLVTVRGMSPQATLTPKVFIFTFPYDEQICTIDDNEDDWPLMSAEWTARDWYLPTDPGIVVCAAQEATGHVLAHVLQVQIQYIPRWRLYRTV